MNGMILFCFLLVCLGVSRDFLSISKARLIAARMVLFGYSNMFIGICSRSQVSVYRTSGFTKS